MGFEPHLKVIYLNTAVEQLSDNLKPQLRTVTQFSDNSK